MPPRPARLSLRRARGALAAWRRGARAFLAVEAASSLLLLAGAVAALVVVSSPWGPGFERLLALELPLHLGGFAFDRPLRFWIDEGLMTLFFLTVGLEIRREIAGGELSTVRRAALPFFAALGGMLAPAGLYLALGSSGPGRAGWGVPMATDIAFAVGALGLLGRRVPTAVRVLLLGLAVIDDVGAIVVIAVFYSPGIRWVGLAVAVAGLAGALALRAAGVRRALAYVPAGAVVWAGLLHAGVHPTLAGVVLGLATPATPDRSKGEERSPVERLEARLHPWVAYGILPLFALANAGVDLRGVDLHDATARLVSVGVVLGLVVGKPVGVLAASAVAVRLRLAARPKGASWRGVAVVGLAAGIGFTMAIFVAGLAFPGSPLLGAAKLGVLAASTLAAGLTVLAGRFLLPHHPAPEKA